MVDNIFVNGNKNFHPHERNGAIPVNIQDQTSDIIDLHLTRYIDEIAIAQDTNIDDTIVYVTCDTLPVAGNTVCFKEDYAFYQAQILTVTPTGGTAYTLLLDTPLDFAFTTSGGCSLRDDKMNVNGSSTPVIFFVSPVGLVDPVDSSKQQKWDITRIMLSITDDSAMDDARFGGITGGITNGVVVRKKDGRNKNIFTAKTNGDFALHSYDVTYIESTLPPSGFYGMRVRRSFAGQEKNGVVIRLDASSGDEIQLIVRDNLTALTSFQAAVQGHIVVD